MQRTILFLLGLAFSAFPASATCVLPDIDLFLMDWLIDMPETFEACASITAGPNFRIVAPGGHATFRAGNNVVLANGFSVDSGARLTIEIGRTDTFAFTLFTGGPSVVVGPVSAGNGPLVVTLNFSVPVVFRILACVGTQSSCIVMGGVPQTRTFNIPSDFPAGAIQALVYFNPNFPPPPVAASGTVSFTYVPL